MEFVKFLIFLSNLHSLATTSKVSVDFFLSYYNVLLHPIFIYPKEKISSEVIRLQQYFHAFFMHFTTFMLLIPRHPFNALKNKWKLWFPLSQYLITS